MLFPVSACRHPGLSGLSEASFLEYFGFTLCRKRGYKRRMSWRRNMSEWIGANSQWERGCRSTGWLYHCTALLALADFVMFLLLHHLHRMQKSKKKKYFFNMKCWYALNIQENDSEVAFKGETLTLYHPPFTLWDVLFMRIGSLKTYFTLRI